VRTTIPLSDDERAIIAHLIAGALGEMAFNECPNGHVRVQERLALAESILRGEHRPQPRRHRARRGAKVEPIEPPEPIGGATE
jgi:hypothetical protein